MDVETIRFEGARRLLLMLKGCSEAFGLLIEAGVVPEPRTLPLPREDGLEPERPRRPRALETAAEQAPVEGCFSTADVLVHARASSR